MKKYTVLPLLLLISASVCLAQSTEAGPDRPEVILPPEIDRVLRDYEAAWSHSDADALASLFTEDGWILRPGHQPRQGRSQIRDAYRNAGGPLRLSPVAHEMSGDMAYVLGVYAYEPRAEASGKFTLILRRAEDGRWLIVSDMDNHSSNR